MTPKKYNHTKYEKARIIGARSLQLAMGAPALLEFPKDMIDPVEMAITEYSEMVIPITVRRMSV